MDHHQGSSGGFRATVTIVKLLKATVQHHGSRYNQRDSQVPLPFFCSRCGTVLSRCGTVLPGRYVGENTVKP